MVRGKFCLGSGKMCRHAPRYPRQSSPFDAPCPSEAAGSGIAVKSRVFCGTPPLRFTTGVPLSP